MTDRLKLVLWIVLLCAVGYSVRSCQGAVNEWRSWESDTTRLFTQMDADRLQRAEDAVEQLSNEAERLRGVAERNGQLLKSLRGTLKVQLDSLGQAQTTSDSLHVALRALETYKAALDQSVQRSAVLEALSRTQDSTIQILTRSERVGWANADSLQALIRRTPKCPRLPLVNVPMPRLGFGYAVTSGGSGVGVGVFVPLGRC